MEDVKNGIISEEALEKVAGGLSIDRKKLEAGLKYAGVAVVGASALVGAYELGKRSGHKEPLNHSPDETPTPSAPPPPEFGVRKKVINKIR